MNEGEREVAKEERREAEEKRVWRRCYRRLPHCVCWSGTTRAVNNSIAGADASAVWPLHSLQQQDPLTMSPLSDAHMMRAMHTVYSLLSAQFGMVGGAFGAWAAAVARKY